MFSVFLFIYLGACGLGVVTMGYIMWKYEVTGVISLKERPCPRCNPVEEENEMANYGLNL